MPRLTQELQFPNQDTNPKAPYNGVAVFCKNGSLYTIDTNGIVALIGSGNSEPVDLSNYYTISETDNAISTAINALINGAPGTLDTLKELADAVNSNKSLVDALNEAISNKQDKLVSGTNIKTINGKSILGTGDITISGGTENAIPINGSSSLSGTFAPSVNLGANLGYKDKKFSYIYADNLGIGDSAVNQACIDNIYVRLKIAPYSNNKGIGLGTSGNWFGALYLGDPNSSYSGKLIPPSSIPFEGVAWRLPNSGGTIALTKDLNDKQDTLVSGTNIKTINGNSLTGSGNITVNELKGFVSYDDERLGTADYSYFAIKPRELPTYNKEKYEAHIGPLNDVSFIQGKLINMSSGTEFDQNYTKEAGNNYWILDIPKKSGTLATLEDIQSSGGSGIDDSTISTSSTYSSSKIDSTYLKAPEGRLDIENGRVNLKNNLNSVYSITNNEVVMELNDDGLRYHDNATNLDVNITPYYGAIDQNVDPATIKVNGIGLARETDLNKKVSLRGDTMTGNLNAPAFTVDSTKVASGDKPLIDGAINFKYKNTNDEACNSWLTMLPSGQLQFGSQGAGASEIGTVATQEWVNKKITNAYIYKGSVDTYDALPSGADPGFVYNVRSNGANYAWTGTEWDELGATVNLDVYALKSDIPSLTGYATESWVESKNYLTTHQSLDSKQDKLVSGTNIKTINGTSILGAGNITISGGSGSGSSGSGIQIYEQMPAPEEVSDGQIIAMPISSGVDVVYNANSTSYSSGTVITENKTITYNSTLGAKYFWIISYVYYSNGPSTIIVPCTGKDFYVTMHTNETQDSYLRCNASTDGKSITLYSGNTQVYIHAVMAF